MKNYTEMKFGDYTFMHNPKTLTIKNRLTGKSSIIPNRGSYFYATAQSNCTISGEGLITGPECFKKLLLLTEVFKDEQAHLLSISPFPSINAILTELEYTLTPKENNIEIKFEFTETSTERETISKVPQSVTVSTDDTLWDISYKYGVTVESLLSINTFVKRPDTLEEGWVIRLW